MVSMLEAGTWGSRLCFIFPVRGANFLKEVFANFEKMITFVADSVVRGYCGVADERESGERPELFLQL